MMLWSIRSLRKKTILKNRSDFQGESSSHRTFSSCFCLIYYSETNLKVKQALTVTAELGEDLQKLTEFTGESIQKINSPENLPKH